MSDTILYAGLALGAIQLAVGGGIGYWVGRSRGRSAMDGDQTRARRLAVSLQDLVGGLGQTVREQAHKLDHVELRLRRETASQTEAEAANPLTSLVMGVVREMMAANLKLQDQLSHAEMEMEEQACEMAEHVKQAMTDPLTGLPNRRALDDHLRNRMDAWRKHRTPFSVLMVDVDHFKRLNDTHGHPAGDAALRSIAQALQESLRKHDVVARFGGEEFAIILPHATLASAAPAVKKALTAVESLPFSASGVEVGITASAGLACMTEGERTDTLLERADTALYAAKENGRNQAWQHNGQRVEPVLRPPAPEEEPDADLASLSQACVDLRAGLSSVLEGPTRSPAESPVE